MKKPIIFTMTGNDRTEERKLFAENPKTRIASWRALQKKCKNRLLFFNHFQSKIRTELEAAGNILPFRKKTSILSTGRRSRAREPAKHFRASIKNFKAFLTKFFQTIDCKRGLKTMIEAFLTQKARADKNNLHFIFPIYKISKKPLFVKGEILRKIPSCVANQWQN